MIEHFALLQFFVKLAARRILQYEIDSGVVVKVAVESQNVRMPVKI